MAVNVHDLWSFSAHQGTLYCMWSVVAGGFVCLFGIGVFQVISVTLYFQCCFCNEVASLQKCMKVFCADSFYANMS